jgi:hypothetical protein
MAQTSFGPPPADSDDSARPACDEAPWADREPLVSGEPVRALVVYRPTLPSQKDVQPLIAVPNPDCRELFVAHAQLGLDQTACDNAGTIR